MSAVMSAIPATDPSIQTTVLACDLTDHASVRAAAAAVLALVPQIHVLINNAGVMALPAYGADRQGVEQQPSPSYLGYFLLTNLLAPGTGSDYLVVLPTNPASVIKRAAFRFGLNMDDFITVQSTSKQFLTGRGPATIIEILGARVDLGTLASKPPLSPTSPVPAAAAAVKPSLVDGGGIGNGDRIIATLTYDAHTAPVRSGHSRRFEGEELKRLLRESDARVYVGRSDHADKSEEDVQAWLQSIRGVRYVSDVFH
ncbi:hypothetical protein GGR56DRAFT_671169 [Xylariaceae sp. FL0804]|nr:hypothetical protein GGR56DRAFT_671169 [Xylariaceae sp. FL0804]